MYKSKTPRKKNNENIKEYSKHKILCELIKKRSHHSVKFVEDMNDSWFIYVLEYKKKTGEIIDNSMIILADYETRLSHMQRCGYELRK